jgi:hypothetical protein
MASRSRGSPSKNRRKQLGGPAVAEAADLKLWDAALAALDSRDRAELQRLTPKHGHPRIELLGHHDPDRARHDELLARAEAGLCGRLSCGAWCLSGYPARARANEPRVSMLPDRAPHATFDYGASSVTVGGDQLIEVVVSTRPVLSLFRSRAGRRATYGFTTLKLSQASFDLLWVLAEAAAASKLPLLADLQNISKAYKGNQALAQGISKLKRDWCLSGTSRDEVWSLLQPIRGTGCYELKLPPERLFLEREAFPTKDGNSGN